MPTPDPGNRDDVSSRLRIASFNILHGRSPSDDRVDLDRFADAVASLDADVLALQEVDRHQQRSAYADLTAVAAEAMGAREHRFVAALAGTPGASWVPATGDEAPDAAAYGIALLSRLPVDRWQVVRLGSPPVPVPVRVPGTLRPRLVREEPRVALAARLDGGLTVINAHLSFVGWWGRRQLQRLVRTLDGTDPLVLAGDLNLGPAVVHRVTGMRPLVSGPTFPADAPREQLDHVLARGDVGLAVDAGTRRLPMSDHLAVTVDLER